MMLSFNMIYAYIGKGVGGARGAMGMKESF
jgi:hypothetical protein